MVLTLVETPNSLRMAQWVTPWDICMVHVMSSSSEDWASASSFQILLPLLGRVCLSPFRWNSDSAPCPHQHAHLRSNTLSSDDWELSYTSFQNLYWSVFLMLSSIPWIGSLSTLNSGLLADPTLWNQTKCWMHLAPIQHTNASFFPSPVNKQG